MKTKNTSPGIFDLSSSLLLFLAIALCALAFWSGCAFTPGQTSALAGATAGNVYATNVLKNAVTPAQQAAAVKALTDLQNELPNIPLGKVSTFDLGALEAELQQAKANLISDEGSENQIDSFIALVANNQGKLSGGVVTPEQAQIFAAFENVATGIGNAVQFWQGHNSVSPAAP